MIILQYADGSRAIDAGVVGIYFDDADPMPDYEGVMRLTKEGVTAGFVTQAAFDAATVEKV
jgi:hypothetical protein